MNKRIKARWVKALRSGKYKQGRTQLKMKTPDGDLFCCLGVLCDLHSKSTKAQWRGENYLDQAAALPEEVQAWSGVDKWGKVPDSGIPPLYELNDGVGCKPKSFKAIATLIEKHL
jgi:hypothetical protein